MPIRLLSRIPPPPRVARLPIPLHLQPAYQHLDYAEGTFPVAEAKAKRIVSLPIYPELTEGQQDRIVATVRAYLEGRAREPAPPVSRAER